MKTFSLLLLPALIAGSILVRPSTSITIASDKALFKKTVLLTNADTVPVMIRTSFDQKYPNASKVIWYRYTPGKTPPDPDAWYATMDNNDYYVSFNWDNSDYIAWYDNGKWVRSSQRIDNIDLPVDVVRAINTQYPGYNITDVDLEHDNKQTLYEVKLVNGDSKWNVHFTPAGVVYRKKERHLNKMNPEASMSSDFTTRFPNATDVTWYHYNPDDQPELLPTDWNYNLDANDYEVRFRSDGTDYVAWYDNGKWIRAEAMKYNSTKLPSSINDAIRNQYAGYTINNVMQDQDYNNQTTYRVVMTKGTEKCKLDFKSDGTMTKKKCKSM